MSYGYLKGNSGGDRVSKGRCRQLVAAGASLLLPALLHCCRPSSNRCSQGRNSHLWPPLAGFFLFLVGSINDGPEAAQIQTGMGNTWHCVLRCLCVTSHPSFLEASGRNTDAQAMKHTAHHTYAPQT